MMNHNSQESGVIRHVRQQQNCPNALKRSFLPKAQNTNMEIFLLKVGESQSHDTQRTCLQNLKKRKETNVKNKIKYKK